MNGDTTAGCAVVLFAVGLVITLGAFFAFIAMSIWNSIVVQLFPGMPLIGFWQMWGIMILINLLFGGLRSVTTSK